MRNRFSPGWHFFFCSSTHLTKKVIIIWFQGVIRASVTQDQHPTQKNLSTPMLEIKAPAIEKDSSPHTAEASIENNPSTVGNEDEDEDEDDWDTFQSFPASTREVTTNNAMESRETEDSEALESSSPSVSMEDSTTLPIDESKINMEHEETSEVVSVFISSSGQRSSDGDLISDRSGMQGVSNQESGNVDIVLNQEHDTQNEGLPGQELSQVTEQVSSELQLADGVENETESMPSDHEILDDEADNDRVREYKEGNEKETVVKTSSVDNQQRNDSL